LDRLDRNLRQLGPDAVGEREHGVCAETGVEDGEMRIAAQGRDIGSGKLFGLGQVPVVVILRAGRDRHFRGGRGGVTELTPQCPTRPEGVWHGRGASPSAPIQHPLYPGRMAPAASQSPVCLPPLVVLGCGFTGSAAARQAVAAGRRVFATTGSEERAASLRAAGIDVRVVPMLEADAVQSLIPKGAHVLLAFPPDGATDAKVSSALGAAASIVYLSTTGVYGSRRGQVDERTPVDPADPRARQRLDAEKRYLDLDATVLRSAGIYGPGRGLHRRVRDPGFRVPGEARVVSRVHVDDLARIAVCALHRMPRGGGGGRIFVVADDLPVPQIEVIRWLCVRLGLPLPQPTEHSQRVDGLARVSDRAVDNTAVKAALGIELMYPSYKEGFEACLVAEEPRP
jgi:nucleoside-diphosphate-sugar epimerase